MEDNTSIFDKAEKPRMMINPDVQSATPDYMQEYERFIEAYKFTEVSGEEIGFLVARMSMYFSRYNMKLRDALRNYSIIMRDFQIGVDETTGKPISSAKAETLAAATPQADTYNEMKIHVANIQEHINSLKALQKGAINEYSHSG